MELVVRPSITMAGKASWDDIYPELRLVFEKLNKIAKDNGLTVSGPPLVLFANPDADLAEYSAMLPVAALSAGMEEKLKPALPGQTPGGKVLRFVHLGAYDTIGQTYDEAANLLTSGISRSRKPRLRNISATPRPHGRSGSGDLHLCLSQTLKDKR